MALNFTSFLVVIVNLHNIGIHINLHNPHQIPICFKGLLMMVHNYFSNIHTKSLIHGFSLLCHLLMYSRYDYHYCLVSIHIKNLSFISYTMCHSLSYACIICFSMFNLYNISNFILPKSIKIRVDYHQTISWIL